MFWNQCPLLLILKMLETKIKYDHMNNVKLPLYNPHCFLVNCWCLQIFMSLKFLFFAICYCYLLCASCNAHLHNSHLLDFCFAFHFHVRAHLHNSHFQTFFFKFKKQHFSILTTWINFFCLDTQCLVKFEKAYNHTNNTPFWKIAT
jgi:hypothetical protein